MKYDVCFSRKEDEWRTPRWLFDALDAEFGFTLDPCATPDSALCDRFYTADIDGLAQDWVNETVFCNPPYSMVARWIRKAWHASQRGATVVCLVPSRTDTKWWHQYVMKGEIRFLRGRLQFNDLPGHARAPFPSALVVFRPSGHLMRSA